MTTPPLDPSTGDRLPIDEAASLVDAVLDGVAGPDDVRRLHALCAAFPECAREWEAASAMQSAFAALKRDAAPPAVARSIAREIRIRRWRAFRSRLSEAIDGLWRPAWKPVLASLAVLLVALFGVVKPWSAPVSEENYTDAEVRLAVEEVKWTLGYVGHVGRKTGLLIRDEVVEPHVVSPIHRSLQAAVGGPAGPSRP